MVDKLGGLDTLLLAYGKLGDQRQLLSDQAAVLELIRTNFESASAWCLATATILTRQRFGVLIVIGSVAGDRGRKSNYVYGACKAGLACVVEGIAHQLARTGAQAVIVKPGLVDTPMTAAFKKGFLWAKPDTVAKAITKVAINRTPIVYSPWYWRFIMIIIRHLPNFVFNRLDI
jgi:decaprenylphospho-beta-D-erythro-pentofuranosid-2-ulose 2-reductase